MSGDDARPDGAPLPPDAPIEPRVELRRGVRGDGEELPLRLLVLGDFTQRPDDRPIEQRKPIPIEDNFSKVMNQHNLSLHLHCANVLEHNAPPLDLYLKFRRLSDMEPEGVTYQVPALRELRATREALTALKGPMSGNLGFVIALRRAFEDPVKRRRLAAECGVPLSESERQSMQEDLAIVQDEAFLATDPTRIAELAGHPSFEVVRALAQNAAIDLDIATRIWERSTAFLELLWNNPGLRSRIRDNPMHWFSKCWHNMLIHVDYTPIVADAVARWEAWSAGEHFTVARWAVAMEMPPEPGELAVANPRRLLDRLPRIYAWQTEHGQRKLERVAFVHQGPLELDAVLQARREAAPGEGEEARAWFVYHHFPWLWCALASWPSCHPSLLPMLAQAPQELVRLAAKSHPRYEPIAVPVREQDTVESALRAFATRPLPEAGRAASTRGSESPNWCQRLFRRRVALGPPEGLSESERPAYDPQASPSAIGHLGRRISSISAALHPNAPTSLLEELLAEGGPAAAIARTQLTLPEGAR